MLEEVANAAASIPKAMITTYIVNTILFFPALLTVCYYVLDLEAALDDLTIYPAIYVLR